MIDFHFETYDGLFCCADLFVISFEMMYMTAVCQKHEWLYWLHFFILFYLTQDGDVASYCDVCSFCIGEKRIFHFVLIENYFVID